jgi:hypothetical protein
MQDLVSLYTGRDFEIVWTAEELDWAAIALQKI